MEEYKWIFSLPSSICIGLIGMLMHFFKKKITGETLSDIVNYFLSNFKSTIIAVVSTVVSVVATYLTLSTGTAIDIISIFGIGYMCDSAFNKYEPK